MSKRAPKPSSSPELSKLVTYQELERLYGLSRRQLNRMQRDGRFPLAIQLSANKRAWRLDVVEQWLAERNAKLAASAVTNAADVPDDQIGDAIAELGSRLAGVSKSDVLGVTVKLTDDQQAAMAAARRARVDSLVATLANLNPIDATVLVRALLPQLAPSMDAILAANGIDAKLTPQQWIASVEPILETLFGGDAHRGHAGFASAPLKAV